MVPSQAVSREDWREAFGLLDTALELEPEARRRWLQALEPEQQRLSPFLEELLRGHAEHSTVDFLGVPAIEMLAGAPPTAPAASADVVVGPYRLLRRIGEGGMASVWLAERADGLLERRVALKLPHLVWGAATFVDRMARERNILGSLEHPNIPGSTTPASPPTAAPGSRSSMSMASRSTPMPTHAASTPALASLSAWRWRGPWPMRMRGSWCTVT